jgi:hypothetical protein
VKAKVCGALMYLNSMFFSCKTVLKVKNFNYVVISRVSDCFYKLNASLRNAVTTNTEVNKNLYSECLPSESKSKLRSLEYYVNPQTGEVDGPKGPEPTRYGDWERNGRCFDF